MAWWWPTGPRLTVAEVTGTATLSRVGADRTLEAREGTALQAADHVRTGEGAEAVLQFGPSTQIRVGPTSSVEVASVDEAGLSLELDEGSVRAIVRPDSGQVRIGNQGRSAATGDGELAVGVRDGVLQIRAIEGDVSLGGVDRDRLVEGEQAIVEGGRARVGKVPSSLLLSVVAPDVTRTASHTHVVQGQTAPGARVVLKGPGGTERVRADATGHFEVAVELSEGENAAVVEASDVFGTTRRTEVTLPVRDTQGPVVRGDVEYPK
ncbi:MAG: FecR domain-containing protein [Myxococcota bacterium]